MISKVTRQIIKNLSLSSAFGLVDSKAYSKLKIEDFGLKEHHLKVIECFSCGEECEIRLRNKKKFIHCIADGCGVRKEINDQDLAYKVTVNDIADFLIKLLEIDSKNKKTLITGEIVFLGRKEVEDLGISFDVYLVRNEKNKIELMNFCDSKLRAIPKFIIRLGNRELNFEEKQIVECCFDDLVFYNQSFERFDINYKVFAEVISGCFEGLQKSTTQKWLNNLCVEWFKKLIKNNLIKRGEKEKYQAIAYNLFNVSPNKYREIWKNNATPELKAKGAIKY